MSHLRSILLRSCLSVMLLCAVGTTYGQSMLPKAKNDSLWAVWKDTRQADTSRLKAMHDIAREGYVFSQPDSAFHYAQMELDFARKKGLKVQMASALNTQGISFYFRGDYDKAIDLYTQSLERSEEAKDKKGMANAYSNIGLVRRRQGDLTLALEHYNKALAMQEEVGNEQGMGILYNNIGSILTDLGDIRQSLEYHHKSLKLYEKLGDMKGMSSSYNNIGIIHIGQGEKLLALDYFEKGLAIVEELGDKTFMASGYYNIGNIHSELKNYDKALSFHQRCLETLLEIGDQKGLSGTYNSLGSVYYSMGNNDLALDYFGKSVAAAEGIGDRKALTDAHNSLGNALFEIKGSSAEGLAHALKSLDYAKELGFPEKIKNAAQTLTKIYRITGRYKEALEAYELYIDMRDSTVTQANKKELLRKQFEYDYDKKEALQAAEQEKKDAIAQEQLHKREVYLGAAAGITFLLGVMSLMAFFAYRAKSKVNVILEKKNHLIEEQKKEITDSILYAENIQRALMPQADVLQGIFPDSFILFQPKDIVSGDFYWMAEHNGTVFLAVGDCTGHGVPGAMLSVIGLNSLNRCISDLGLFRPKDVLMQMTLDLLVTFEGAGAQVRDGMDIALCAIDLKSMTLTYAGANNPLWIARNDEMLILKAARRAVGYHDGLAAFEQEEVALQKGDSIYLSSDGFQDQMGGPNDKKYMTRKFRELLLSTSTLPMNQQHQAVLQEFSAWKGDSEQTDDVCVMGVRF